MTQINPLPPSPTPPAPAQSSDQVAAKTSVNSTGFKDELEAVQEVKKPPELAAGWRVSRKGAEVSTEINDFSFSDFIDIVNPLQHLPLVGDAYRALTGDEIKPVSQVTGDILYAGATGGLSIVNSVLAIGQAAYKDATGESPALSIASAIFGTDKPSPDQAPPVLLADAAPQPVPAPTTPVQSATLSASQPQSSSPSLSQTVSKQPYGGVLDPVSAARAQQLAEVQQDGAARLTSVGNIIYTSPSFTNAARVRAADLAGKSANPQVQVKMAEPSLSIPGSTPLTNQTLGQLMQQSAIDAKKSGGQSNLPPNLVQDMMLMALDKYKGASGLAASELDITP